MARKQEVGSGHDVIKKKDQNLRNMLAVYKKSGGVSYSIGTF